MNKKQNTYDDRLRYVRMIERGYSIDYMSKYIIKIQKDVSDIVP